MDFDQWRFERPDYQRARGVVSIGSGHELRAELDDYPSYLVGMSLGIRRRHANPQVANVIDEALNSVLGYQQASDAEGWSPALEARLNNSATNAHQALDRACRLALGLSFKDARPNVATAPFPSFDLFGDMVLVRAGTDTLTGQNVNPFYISRFPVTVAQYAEFCRVWGWQAPSEWEAAKYPRALADHPVTGITLFDALMFCIWLEAATSFRFRLPTEAEWCFAATRGERLDYPWGDTYELGQGATSFEAGATQPVGVATGQAQDGICDLVGNVWELTATLFDDSPSADMDCEFPPTALAMVRHEWWNADTRIQKGAGPWFEAARFVMYGGSWGGDPEWAKVGARIWSSAMNYGEYGGFRVVCSAERVRGSHMPSPSFLVAEGERWVQRVRLRGSDWSRAEMERTFSACGGCVTGRHDVGDELLRHALRRYDFAEDDSDYYTRVGLEKEMEDAVSGYSLAERALRADSRFPDLRPRY